jgi:single-stranded-DNA-specific exonuclease
MTKRWFIKESPSIEQVKQLSEQLSINNALSTLLIQRKILNYEAAQDFFRPNLKNLHDPFLMKNMEEAVNRIELANKKNERILLFGDYDVDGTTAVALMWEVLSQLHSNIDYYIPDRYKEGYGISFAGIDYAEATFCSLIIALDCGIKAHDKVNYANEKGIDFIICDHHEPGETVPDAIILDPKQKDCTYPYKELSGCGVGFKLLQAYFEKNELDFGVLYKNLDLLAISIGADLVPITGENRILAYFGLEMINKKPRLGFDELLKQAKKTLPLSMTNVVFIIAPRINAAGRIHEGKKAVQLMISQNEDELGLLAKSIEEDNIERRALDKKISDEALEMLESDSNFENQISTVVFNDNWHKGVIGIVASRLIEKHYKPTIVLTKIEDKYTGSARSIKGLDIHDALDECTLYIEQFGGHSFAAGMTIHKDNIHLFKSKFEEVVREKLKKEDTVPIQEVDYELNFIELFEANENRNLVPKFKRIIDQLEPHGPGNMKPVFISKNVYVEDVRLLKDLHLKLILTQPGTGITMAAIGFNLGDKIDLVLSKDPIDILYTLETNEWNNQISLQLNIKDIRLSI